MYRVKGWGGGLLKRIDGHREKENIITTHTHTHTHTHIHLLLL